MTSSIVPQQPRNLQAHSTEQFPEGLYIDHVTGAVFASQSSAARLIDKDPIYVRNFVEAEVSSGKIPALETAEVLTTAGIRSGKIIPESLILALIAKYKPDLLSACASAGLRVFLHRLAGFDVVSTAIAPPKSDRELMLEAQMRSLELERDLANTQARVFEVEKIMKEKENYILKAAEEAPGLRGLMEYAQGDYDTALPLEERENWTLYEWMVDHKKIVLEGTMFNKFVSKVHGAYKAVRHEAPMVAYRPQVNNPKQSKRVQVYTDRDFGILTQCYHQTLLEA